VRFHREYQSIEAPSIVGYGSTWVPMGRAETSVMRLSDNSNLVARDALALRPRTACGSHRSLTGPPHPEATRKPPSGHLVANR
jgi:hypothetical protein